MLPYIATYLAETKEIVERLDRQQIIAAWQLLRTLKSKRGRLFILGNGGSAANASHAVNDFRKIGRIRAYTPTDNVAELTAWTNDMGWSATFIQWLTTECVTSKDLVLVLSVGGGGFETSVNLVRAMMLMHSLGIPIVSIVSRDGGEARELSAVCILVPVVSEDRITPHAEEFQSIICHLLVNALAEDVI